MKLRQLVLATAVAAAGLSSALVPSVATAQAKEQFFPLLVYRTGAYAPNGTPWANGKQDYIKMINARDGGVNGVKLTFEECETGYDTKKGVECYESVKSKNPVVINPYSTGITLQIIPKAAVDKVPILSMAYGLSAAGRSLADWGLSLSSLALFASLLLTLYLVSKHLLASQLALPGPAYSPWADAYLGLWLLVLVLAALFTSVSDLAMVQGALRGLSLVVAGVIMATALRMTPALKSNPLGKWLVWGLVAATVLLVGMLHVRLIWVLMGLGSIACWLAARQLRALEANKESKA